MTSASMTFGRPARLTIPRGALWFAAATSAVIEGLRRIDRWQLSLLRKEEPRSADEVLELAQRLEAPDPGFAADLRAAALRAMDGGDR